MACVHVQRILEGALRKIRMQKLSAQGVSFDFVGNVMKQVSAIRTGPFGTSQPSGPPHARTQLSISFTGSRLRPCYTQSTRRPHPRRQGVPPWNGMKLGNRGWFPALRMARTLAFNRPSGPDKVGSIPHCICLSVAGYTI
jgi:hypothetical protein